MGAHRGQRVSGSVPLLAAMTAAAALVMLPWAAAHAQHETAGRGFLFGAPAGSFTFRGGYSAPSAGSDVFDFVTRELTLRRGDFGSFAFGGDVAVRITDRVEVALSGDIAGMSKRSEFREWEDNSGNPIEQSTSFSRQTYAASVRYSLLRNGRTLGRFAWVPSRYVPWVSVGAGRTLYTFNQDGDFIDFNAGNKVFRDTFRSSQWATTGQVGAGLDWTLTQRFALTTQAKYFFGKAELEYDFSGFDPIDLSGLGLTTGLSIRF
jgi:hypothetical protein